MSESSQETKKKILESAKKEFLEKGFMNASLRTIAANASLTTGAMYRHFKDKDALFCALVDKAIEVTTRTVMLADVLTHMQDVNPLGKEHEEKENETLFRFLDYIYSDFDAFILLISKSAGSTHENFVEEMSDLYTKNCAATLDWMYEQGFARKKLDQLTVHVIASSLINAFTEFITHRVSKEEAIKFISNIRDFFHFGTMAVMDVKSV
ncbi:MAG: TetR/AcrR family transcriptional regulator [Treponemataceae bacterium]|nr:TetR/AcrR family transcriptional regulator [Treponemataceae bacterium]